jgi:uncharacterized CHY-type Zn-finger protein
LAEARESKKDYAYDKWVPKRTTKTAHTPSISGKLIMCPHCKTVTRLGTLHKDNECPFCHKAIPIKGRRKS